MASRSRLLSRSLIAAALGSTFASSAHAGLPSGITLGDPIDVAAQHFVSVPGSSPSVATNGTDALECWADGDTRCVRFTAAGVALDQVPITSTLGQTFVESAGGATVAWDGAAYVVMSANQWQTLDPASGALGPIYRIDQPWNPPGFYLEPEIVGFGGGEILAIMDNDSVAEVELFTETGGLVASFYASGLPWYAAAAAYSNGVFLFVWNTEDRTVAVRIKADGTLLDTTPFFVDAANPVADAGTIGTANGTPVVAGSNDGFLVAWLDNRRTSTFAFDEDLYVSLVGTDGTVSKGGYRVALNAAAPTVTWDGTRWWAGWLSQSGSTASFEPIAADGTVGTGVAIAGAAALGSPGLAATPSTTFTGVATSSAVVAARFSPSGTQLDNPPITLSNASVPAASPSLAASSSGYLVTWSETAPAQYQTKLLGERLGLDGSPQDVPPLVLGTESTAPIASAGGAYFMVTAVGTGAVSVLRIPANGSPQATYLVTPASDGSVVDITSPSIVCAGDQCLVSWTQSGSQNAALINDAGDLVVPPFAIPSGAIAAPGASSFLLAYGTTSPLTGSDVTLQSSGALTAPVLFANDEPVAAAWGLDRFLVVSEGGDVARLDAAGVRTAVQASFAGGLPGAAPRLAWDGRAFLATFGLQGQAPVALEIPASGAVSTAEEFPVFAAASTASPLVASAGAGQVLAVAFQSESGTPRLVARRITVAEDAPEDGGVDSGKGDGADAGDAGGAAAPDASIAVADGGEVGGGDAGEPDASTVDATAAAGDAGGAASSLIPPPGEVTGASGCGCRAAGGNQAGGVGASLAWLGALAAVVARMRRRRALLVAPGDQLT